MQTMNLPHRYADSFGNGVCERVECGQEKDAEVHRLHELRLNFTFLAHEHRGIEGHPTWACTGCGAVIAEQFLSLHSEKCEHLK